MSRVNRTLAASTIVGASLLLAFCSQQSAVPTSPAAGGAVTARALAAVGDTTTSTPEATLVKICKLGNVSGTFTVAATPVSGGSASVLTPITVASGTCRIAAVDTDSVTGVGSTVLVTETSAGLQSVSAVELGGPFTFVNGQTALFLNAFHGYTVTFTNNVTPPTVVEGCSPGFFKNHTDTPAGFDRSQTLDAVLQTTAFSSSLTIAQALDLKGGGLNALARHAAAAILNATALPTTYSFTLAQLRAIFDQVDAGTLSIDAASALLESKEDNETTILCPLS